VTVLADAIARSGARVNIIAAKAGDMIHEAPVLMEFERFLP